MSIYRFILCSFRRTDLAGTKRSCIEVNSSFSNSNSLLMAKSGSPVARETLRPGDHQEGTKVEAPQLAKEG